MELGQKIRQARLEAGLSQRQLCGDMITRNMLSQIENGAARPSMTTLQYIASRLGKTVGYFLEEEMPALPNQRLMEQARQAKAEQILQLMEQYQSPDPVFDRERWLLEAFACLELAEHAIREDKLTYAKTLLDRAKAAGVQTPYYTAANERTRLVLCEKAGDDPAMLAAALPCLDDELLLRAQAALYRKDTEKAANLLDSAEHHTHRWHYLRGCVYEAQEDLSSAAEQYLQAVDWSPQRIYSCLERCYKNMGDFKRAYEYACLQR